MTTKLKIGFLSPISGEWFNIHNKIISLVNTIDDADYIIFESNGDPIPLIMNIKARYPKNKLVFILSGDQSIPIDDECIWFTNAKKQSGLAKKQTQIFVSNPAIFKYFEKHCVNIDLSVNQALHRDIDIYFKGTIWTGMRTDMYNYFKDKPGCNIIQNNDYWGWRLNGNKPSQKQIEETAYDSYNDIFKSKLCLCPKGNGNSSMRIIEAIACGSIPVLINDFSSPFGTPWGDINNKSSDAIGLVFDTKKDSWDEIYYECINLINDKPRYDAMKNKGLEYFKNVIYADSQLEDFKMYNSNYGK
jgi:hypothetical protein